MGTRIIDVNRYYEAVNNSEFDDGIRKKRDVEDEDTKKAREKEDRKVEKDLSIFER